VHHSIPPIYLWLRDGVSTPTKVAGTRNSPLPPSIPHRSFTGLMAIYPSLRCAPPCRYPSPSARLVTGETPHHNATTAAAIAPGWSTTHRSRAGSTSSARVARRKHSMARHGEASAVSESDATTPHAPRPAPRTISRPVRNRPSRVTFTSGAQSDTRDTVLCDSKKPHVMSPSSSLLLFRRALQTSRHSISDSIGRSVRVCDTECVAQVLAALA